MFNEIRDSIYEHTKFQLQFNKSISSDTWNVTRQSKYPRAWFVTQGRLVCQRRQRNFQIINFPVVNILKAFRSHSDIN